MSGNFELNVMMPVIAWNLLESIRLLSTSSRLLADRCVAGITANVERMRTYAESSPSVVTPLNRYIGYENAAKVAKKALAEEKTSSRWSWRWGTSTAGTSPSSSSTRLSTWRA
jgi:fumarate hydratase class II